MARHYRFLSAPIVMILSIAYLHAEQPQSREFFHAGPIVSWISVNGEFDGTLSLYGSGERWAVPKVNPGFCYGATAGFTFPVDDGSPLGLGVDVAFLYSPLTGTWESKSFPVRYMDFDLRLRVPYAVTPFLSFFGQAGVGFPSITVSGGAETGTVIGDAALNGYEWSVGGGIWFAPFETMGFHAAFVQHFSGMYEGKGIGVAGNIETVTDNTSHVEAGVSWLF